MKGLYEQSVLPDSFNIMGRAMKPFSVGHFLVLRRDKVCFVSDEPAKMTLEDILFTVFVCSRSYRDAKELLYNGKWIPEVLKLGREVREQSEKFIPEGGTIDDVYVDFAEIGAHVQAYIEYHTQRPWFQPIKGNSTGTVRANAEWYEGIIKTLMGKCGYSHHEVMDMPFSRFLYEHISYLEQQGIVTMFDARRTMQKQAMLKRKTQAKDLKCGCWMFGLCATCGGHGHCCKCGSQYGEK
jgi:hypothetical protein